MSTSVRPLARWRFGECVLDAASLELTVNGQRVRLEPKPLDLLLFLLRHPGEVVTKDELQEQVWPGRVLSESVLSKAMAKLRQGLGDEDQALIRTAHGYGYRLVAPVTLETAPPSSVPMLPELLAGQSPAQRPHWKLLERLGGGGYGDVWLAEHDATRERRVFKFGTDADSLSGLKREITLFRLLHQTLGERADLVKLLDWNLEEPPYFVEAEYATGGSLLQWAQAQGGLATLDLGLRIELGAQIAEALAAAHSAGVLHKDLKPSNVLIALADGTAPRIKLGDFGSGRVLDLTRLEQLEITRMGFTRTALDPDSGSGTPFYFAPELLAGQQPTAQSDLYALGVLLYQLVAGDFTRPLAPGWEQEIADELLREDIAAAAASRPSNRLGDAAELARRLRALDGRRVERAAQHRSAAEARELRAALERARVRRSWALALAGVFALALAVTAVLLAQLSASQDAAEAATRRAEQEAAVARAVDDFLVNDLIKAANPFGSGRGDVTVREVLDAAAAKVDARFSQSPETAAAVHLSLGESYLGLADFAKAETQFRQALNPDASAHAPAARLSLAALYTQTDQLDQAAAVLEPLLAAKLDGPLHLRAQLARATILNQRGDYAAALQLIDGFLPQARSDPATDPAFLADAGQYRGHVLQGLGRHDEALQDVRIALDAKRQLYGERHVQTIEAMRSLGGTLGLADRAAEAVPVLREARRIALDTLGEPHDKTLLVAADLATALHAAQQFVEAESLTRTALALREQQFGEEHKETRTLYSNLAYLLGDLGRHEEEQAMNLRLHDIEKRLLGEAHVDVLGGAHNIGRTWQDMGQWDRAENIQKRTLELARKSLAADHWQLGLMQYAYADTLAHRERYDEADALFAESITLLEKSLGTEHKWTLKARALREAAQQRRAGKAPAARAGR